MIALVLAAGFGTRLHPYSHHTPKPLFTLNGQPLLDILIRQLLASGVRTVIVNTHHRREMIEGFLAAQPYAPQIVTRHEPAILGTGGAIRNTADIWHPHPLLVVNSDITTDLNFQAFGAFHRAHRHPVSMALCDHPTFNSVSVDAAQRVIGFRNTNAPPDPPGTRCLTFTGIQLIEKDLLTYIPPEGFANSIDAYRAMIDDGRYIQAYIPSGVRWSDLGTPERYLEVARAVMAASAFGGALRHPSATAVRWQALAGDGSDRRWYRATALNSSLVVAEHGIKPSPATCEAEAFVAIGDHLHRQGLPVPKIFCADTFAGLVFMEDLGDRNLQALVDATPHLQTVETIYRRLIDVLLDMNRRGGEGFDPAWTYQTARYDREVVLQNECRYFEKAFLEGYLDVVIPDGALTSEFRRLADRIDAIRPLGFMHRDFQSRNIMVRDDRFYLIDFQGGRLGPPHYDLAALLIDPYVDLSEDLRESLLGYFSNRLAALSGIPGEEIRRACRHCALARNLQILGAYGFLSRRKGKTFFARYIPTAVRRLRETLSRFEGDAFPVLAEMAHTIIPAHLPPEA